MATEQIKLSPLPPLATTDPLTQDQWRTLLAFADTVVPSIVPAKQVSNSVFELGLPAAEYNVAATKLEQYAGHSADPQLVRNYLVQKASDIQLFKDCLWRVLSQNVSADLKVQTTMGLNLLNYRVTSLLLTGKPVAFADQPVQVRDEIIQSWSRAKIPILRLLFKSLTLLVKQTWAKSSMLLHDMISMPRVPVHGTPVKGFGYRFIEIPPGEAPEIIETDVVIVGSGCGAGVVAKNLAAAGFKVIVTDKGYHWPAEHFPMVEAEGWSHLFHNGGFLFSDDSSTCIIAGETWGGGGTVNWSASLQPQDFVRKEWAARGLPFFTTAEFQDCLDTVCGRMGVGSAQIRQNPANAKLLEGARKLGMTAKIVPQNTAGNEHYCGYCTMGCAACQKQGPANSWLVDAAENGARFMEGLDVQKVVFEKDAKSGRQVAVGVEGTWTSRDEHGGVAGNRTSRKVIVRAKRVVVSAGTMNTPLVLMRSGLKNRHIGKNLKLHPVQIVGAIHDKETKPWEGGILTSVVSSLENLDGKGHGTKLECTTMLPSCWLSFPVWRGGADWKLLAPKHRNMAGYISLSRDIGSGRVYPDPKDGRVCFSYNTIRKDRKHIMAGLQALAKINYVEGAREIFTALPTLETFVRLDPQEGKDTEGINDARFQTWLKKMESLGLPDPDATHMSAHQMGTCRMGATPKKGAIDPYGRIWEADGLYVADASTFPSASGVNPMVTNMGISEWVSRNIIKDLRSGGKTRGKL